MSNLFREGSQINKVYEVLLDKNWHCSKCDLDAAQAATYRDMKRKGVELDTNENGQEFKKMFCQACNVNRIHRKIK